MLSFRTAHAGSLRLMTYNVNYSNLDVATTLDAIADADTDLVLLQEITREWKRALAQRFADHYPHHIFRIHARASGGLAVLSKHAIASEELFPSPERGWFPAERLVVEGPFGALQILHVHLRPAIDGGSWIKGYITTPPLRRREIESYWHKLSRDLPTVIAGDFNEEASGKAVTFLQNRGLARVRPSGPTTWRYERQLRGRRMDLLKLDIDHVLLCNHLRASDAQVLETGASDHRPVVVTIAKR